MTFRHLCLFKLIRPWLVVVIVALKKFGLFVFISSNQLLTQHILCLNSFVLSSFSLKLHLSLPSYHLLLLFLFACVSLRLSLSHFFDRYKTARRVRQHSRRVVSFRLFRSRRGSVSLCALLIFLPLHRVCLCVYECMCMCSLRIVYVSY
jgi:hypothetical protein